MKITDLKIVSFRTFADRFTAGTPQPHQELVQTVTSIETDTGVTRFCGAMWVETGQAPSPEKSRCPLKASLKSHRVGANKKLRGRRSFILRPTKH